MYFFLSVTSRVLLFSSIKARFLHFTIVRTIQRIFKRVYNSLVLHRAALAIQKDNCIVIDVPFTDLVNYVFMFSGFF